MQTESSAPQSTVNPIFSRVLVPVNFSMLSHEGVLAALDLQRCCGARVCVFNVSHAAEDDQFLATLGSPANREDMSGGGGGGSAAVRRFVSHIAPGREDSVECEAKIADDYVAAIRAKMQEWQATLLVLSHTSHHSLLRTHTDKLIQSAGIPILLLPPPKGSDQR